MVVLVIVNFGFEDVVFECVREFVFIWVLDLELLVDYVLVWVGVGIGVIYDDEEGILDFFGFVMSGVMWVDL